MIVHRTNRELKPSDTLAPNPAGAAPRRSILLQALLVAGVSLALALPSVRFAFVWDDPWLIVNNPAVTGEFSLVSFFSTTLVLRDGPTAFFRPLQLLVHGLEYRIFGTGPAGYHAVSALLHAAASLLVFLSARVLAPAGWGACAGALLFAVHPVHAEAVSFISSRGDLLATCFALLAFLAAVRAAAVPGRRGLLAAAAGAGAAYALSLFSKESGLLLPVVLVAWPWLRGEAPAGAPPRRRVAGALAVALAIGLAAYLSVRLSAAGKGLEKIPGGLDPGGALRRLAAYLRMLVDPTALQIWWPEVGAGWTWGSLAGAVLLAASFGLAWRLRSRFPSSLFLWGWFLVTLLPVLKLVPFRGSDLAARYLYLPSVALCWAVASGWGSVERLSRSRRGAAVTAGVFLVALLAWPWYRETGAWRTDLTLYQRMTREEPDSAMAHYNLGNTLAAAGRTREGIQSLEEAVRLAPAYASAHHNLGRYLADAGRFAAAGQHLETYLRLRPQAPDRAFTEAMLSMVRKRARLPDPR